MIKTLLKIGIFLVVAIIGYNYFLGDETEKQNSREFVGKVGDLGKDAWNLLRSERQKMKDGKYDDALDKLDNLYGDLRERAEDVRDSGALERISELNRRREELQDELGREGDQLSPGAKRKLEDLTNDTEALMDEMETKSRTPAPY